MTPHKIAQEVTGEELQNKYVIQSSFPKVTSWVKDVFFLVDGLTRYEGRLRWNENDGYEVFWDDKTPPEADRPEFNYILDSLTRQDYY
jgi:hypothetical protein